MFRRRRRFGSHFTGRRIRRRPRWGPIFGLFLVGNLAVGAYWSQITRVTSVRVEGAPAYEEERIQEILRPIANTPFFQINRQSFEWGMQRRPEVLRAQLDVGPFGQATVRMTYRQPVLQLDAPGNVVMDASGVIFRLPSELLPKTLPRLRLPKKVPPTLLGFGGDYPIADLARIAPALSTVWPAGGVRIDVDERGVVCLNKDSGRVILGSTDDMERKLAALRRFLSTDGSFPKSNLVLNLTQPEFPADASPEPAPHSEPRTP